VFEAELSDKIKQIFDVSKVTFDTPGESREQDCIYIEVENCKTTLKDARQFSKVTGRCYMISQSQKLPFGYLTKKLIESDKALTKDLYAYEFEENSLRYRNLIERSFSFIYFFTSQYNPDIGTIESIELTSEVT